MIKRLKYIFIPVLAVFLMSHNVNALDLTINLNDYENLNYSVSPDYYDYVITNTSGTVVRTCDKTQFCQWNNAEQLRVAKTHKSFDLQVGDIIIYKILVYTPGEFANLNYLMWNHPTPGGGINNLYFHLVSDFQGVSSSMYGSDEPYLTYNHYKYTATYEVANIITIAANKQLGSLNQNTVDGTVFTNSGNNNFLIGVSGFNVYRKKDSSSINQEQVEATQDAADNSSTAGDSSSSDATSATSSLLSVIGSGIGAITSATPSNCRINGNMGNLDMGSIDLCANPVPAFVAVIGSFIAVALVLPLVIILFNRFISIIRSFQN